MYLNLDFSRKVFQNVYTTWIFKESRDVIRIGIVSWRKRRSLITANRLRNTALLILLPNESPRDDISCEIFPKY